MNGASATSRFVLPCTTSEATRSDRAEGGQPFGMFEVQLVHHRLGKVLESLPARGEGRPALGRECGRAPAPDERREGRRSPRVSPVEGKVVVLTLDRRRTKCRRDRTISRSRSTTRTG